MAPTGTTFFPSLAEKKHWDDYLSTILNGVEERVNAGPVAPRMDARRFSEELAKFDFKEPVALGDLFDWTVAGLEQGLVHLTHTRYLGLFNPAPSFPSQCADRISATFNPQLASAATSPAAVAIETHVCRAVARQAGLGKAAAGHFTSGGSEANGTALVCALSAAEPKFTTHGARAFSGQPVFYISEDSHLAWIKLAHQGGIGRVAARMVRTDGDGRMDAPTLADAIRADKASGCVPFMIAATAGTTNAGMIDPLEACAEIARGNGLWFHVDAAWGGGLIASPQLSGLLAGIELADSITIDAHKWFATTMGCGMFLTPHTDMVSATFNVTASFMPSQSPCIDPYLNSAQWSRRFSGLRLFLSLAAGGWAGHAAHVKQCIDLAAKFAQDITARGWRVLNSPALAVVCALPPAGSPPVRDIVANVVGSGRGWVSLARFEGQDTVRACVTNGKTSEADIAKVIEALIHASTLCGTDTLIDMG